MQTSKEKGDHLEIRMENILRRLGMYNIKRNVRLKDSYGNWSEIDLTYGLFSTHFVECKAYSNKVVPLSDVAKFKEVMILHGIPISKGLFVTTSTFVPRAKTVGVKIIDGDALIKLEKKSFSKMYRRRAFYLLSLSAFTFNACLEKPFTLKSIDDYLTDHVKYLLSKI